jgi:hypothetical protein
MALNNFRLRFIAALVRLQTKNNHNEFGFEFFRVRPNHAELPAKSSACALNQQRSGFIFYNGINANPNARSTNQPRPNNKITEEKAKTTRR